MSTTDNGQIHQATQIQHSTADILRNTRQLLDNQSTMQPTLHSDLSIECNSNPRYTGYPAYNGPRPCVITPSTEYGIPTTSTIRPSVMSTVPTSGPLGPQFGASNEALNEATYINSGQLIF